MEHEGGEGMTDRELMQEVRAGRTAALGELFERNHDRIFRFCMRMTGNRPVSEDLVQDIFMRMLKYRKTYRDEHDFRPWMYRLARNACTDYYRRGPKPGEALEEAGELVSEDPLASEVAEQDESVGRLRQALLKLPLHRREVLVLSRYEFKSYDEIATLLDCSVGAVKVRVHRAIKHLRKIYRELESEAIP